MPGSTKIAKFSSCLVGATLLGGCSLSLGAAGTRAWSSPTSSHIGFTTRGWFALPQEYRYVVGAPASLVAIRLGPTRPGFLAGRSSVAPSSCADRRERLTESVSSLARMSGFRFNSKSQIPGMPAIFHPSASTSCLQSD